MQSPSIPELSDRARDIFRTIVDSYLASGTPVGSRTLSKLGPLGLSAASIRNVMQDLEELGLLAAPHVSAGRKPTEMGLRLFVDGMMQAALPTDVERAAIDSQMHTGQMHSGSPMADILTRTTAVLSGLSSCAGLVLVPKAEPILRQISFVALSPVKALVVLVGADGSVENRVIDVPADLPPSALIEAANYINVRLAGQTLRDAATQLALEIAEDRAAIDALTQSLVAAGLASWSADGASRPVLIVRGQAHLLDDSATDLDRVRRLLDDIEGKQDLVQVLELAQNASAMKIFIGAENKLFALSGSSVIAAPYRVGGSDSGVVGVIGVIGPTRLNYARIIPMVDYAAKTLSRLMT